MNFSASYIQFPTPPCLPGQDGRIFCRQKVSPTSTTLKLIASIIISLHLLQNNIAAANKLRLLNTCSIAFNFARIWGLERRGRRDVRRGGEDESLGFISLRP